MSLIFWGIIILCLCIVTGWCISKVFLIGTGYVAKYLCSSTFISKREPEKVFQEDVAPINPLTKIITWKIDHKEQSVKATAFRFFTSRAIYREGCGCTLVQDTTEEQLRQQTFYQSGSNYPCFHHQTDLPWPEGSKGPIAPESLGINSTKLQKVLDAAFAEPDSDNPRKTRAILIVYDGHLIAERYAPGFSPQMPLLGWSMSKSITNALVGILVRKGRLNVNDPAPVPEWQDSNDPRQKITLDQLLRMSSGLKFKEVYGPISNAIDMLYTRSDFAAYAAQKPLEAEPDTQWNYSSGTANIVARIVRKEAEKLYENYYRFLHQELFDKIGMYTALMEPDASGTFVGSSYTFASPRDWARFGLLYLQDGIWNGERILPEGWMKYTTTPTAKAPKGEYGVFFWLNAGVPSNPHNRMWPDAPRDTFAARGFQEQRVIIIPSKKLVLVRLGATAHKKAWNTNEFISNVLKALPDEYAQ